jgi:hypothetical protein
MIDTPVFTPDPDNDKTIIVKGWGETELQRIVNGFFADGMSRVSDRIEIQAVEENLFRLSFPDDISFSDFACLVNYLNYPANLEPTGRTIVAVGRSTMTEDFHGISEPMAGAKAIVYVPESDRDYDVVHLQTEMGTTLMNSFSEGVWRRVNEPRLPDEVTRLSSFL